MLKDKQFEAFGRITLAFNHIESVIQGYTAILLTPEELSIGWAVAEDGTFQNKASRLKRILDAICREYPTLEAFAAPILAKLIEAKKLAETRNGYVHALIDHDFGKNETWLRVRNKRVACDEKAMFLLSGQMSTLVWQLGNDVDKLFVQLQRARTLPRQVTFKPNVAKDPSPST